MQQFVSLDIASESSAPLPAGQTLSDALSIHPIEPELRQNAIPRRVTANSPKSGTATASAVVIAVMGLACLAPLSHNWLLTLAIVAGVVATYSALYQIINKTGRRQKNLLVYGIAKPSMVIRVEPHHSDTCSRVSFVSETRTGSRLLHRIILTNQQIAQFELQRGKVFTLLVSPTDENDVLPYFLADAYTVTETEVNASRPQRIIMPTTSLTQGAIAADSGVEAELFCVAPRRVVWKRGVNLARIVFLNGYAGVCCVALYYLRTMPNVPLGTIVSIGVAAMMPLIGWCICEHTLWRARFFLRSGYATLATVTRIEVDEQTGNLHVKYQYHRDEADREDRDMMLAPSQALNFGGMKAGTTFTVLRHPNDPYEAVPYFQIEGVELSGGGSPFVTAPTP